MEEELIDIGTPYSSKVTNNTAAESKPQLDECTTDHFVNCPSTD